MRPRVLVYDPTVKDELSKVRGVGRYLQILKENFAQEFTFTDDLSTIKQFGNEAIFINPFLNFVQPPQLTKRIAQREVAVIHDLIALKYPEHFPTGLRGRVNILKNKLALKHYDLVITDSKASKNDIVEILGIEENKVKVVYPCLPRIFENSKIGNSLRIENSKIGNYCVYVGDATWNKNLVNLARAIKIAYVRCVFVGKVFAKSYTPAVSHPWQRELREFLELAKDDNHFIFPGFVSDRLLIEYYRKARLNILVSADEGFGFSFLEASQFGVPSVLSNIPVLCEVAGKAALFADPKSPQDIEKKIKKLFNSSTLRKQIGNRAMQRIKQFSSEQFKKEFLAAI